MYLDHVPNINAAMRHSPDLFCRGVMFAVLSARVQFVRVPEQMKELTKRGAKAQCLWNWKADAFRYLTKNKLQLWRDVCAANDPEAALKILCQIPGLGIVKGAFVLQMLGHDVACLDVRNIQREGLAPRAYRTDGVKTGAAFERKVQRYVRQTFGRARELWDTWCREVADDYGMTAEDVSRLHLSAIVPAPFRSLTPVVPFSYNADIPF